jgi:putative radical SAM enzyme (TIGR03279 family)
LIGPEGWSALKGRPDSSDLLDSQRVDTTAERLGGIVAGVRPGGLGARAGLHARDRIVAVDGLVLRDVIDLQDRFQAGRRMRLDIVRDGRWLAVDFECTVDDLGIDFEQPTFDGLRQCNNGCEFCFIRGLPKGLRRSLYVRDDDYRYSFLYGSFVTLTNLGEHDWARISFQRLSPLRVSVHATDPTVRSRMLAHPGAPPILPQLRGLGRVGVKVHAQIVLCPGINDGEILEQTLRDLGELSHVVESVAVVPVGVSDHLRLREVRPLTTEDAGYALEVVLRWNRAFRRRLGRGLVYPSDELFIVTGRRIPSASFYDAYPQLQNGVGLTRLMLSDWWRARRRLPAAVAKRQRLGWICGRAARSALERMASDARAVHNLHVEVINVDSSLFGSAITVSGLMSGRDAAAALAKAKPDLAVLPRSMFGHEGQRTLDEWTVDQIAKAAGVPIRLGSSASDIVGVIRDLASTGHEEKLGA